MQTDSAHSNINQKGAGAARQFPELDLGFLPGLSWKMTMMCATELAMEGSYAEAAGILNEFLAAYKDKPDALDLLARIRAQQGNYDEAETLWGKALLLDPGNRSYTDAITRIRLLRKNPPIKVPVRLVAFLLVLICIASLFFFITRDTKTVNENNRDEPAVLSMIPTEIPDNGINIREDVNMDTGNIPPEIKTEPAAPRKININIPGLKAKLEKGKTVLVFDKCIFHSITVLTSEAEKQLTEIGRQLLSEVGDFEIEIIGHTDNTPVPTGWIYEDNYSVGIERACVVMKCMKNTTQIPAKAFVIRSFGETDPPFPNDSLENKIRNRTVTIRISKTGN